MSEYKITKFYSENCAPCKMLEPVVNAYIKENPKIELHNVNVDQYPEEASRYNVRSIPTMVFFKDNKPMQSFVGRLDKSKLEEIMAEVQSQ